MNLKELFEISVYHGYAIQILFAEVIFFIHFKRKENCVLRCLVGLIGYTILSICVPNIVSKWVEGFFSFIIFLISLGFWSFVLKEKFTSILFSATAALLLQNFEHHVECLVYLNYSDNLHLVIQFFLSGACMLVIYTGAYYIFAHRLKDGIININSRFIFALVISVAVFCYFMQWMLMVYEIDGLWITHPPLMICCIFGLSLQFGLFEYGKEKQENAMLETLIELQKKQYALTSESVNIINMKAHDLKNYVIQAKSLMRDDEDGLDEIVNAIDLYENSVNTGNKVLDAVLTEKKLICEHNGINFTIMVDGEKLSFMKSGDIISLFANALDNAIEHECIIQEVSKRCIALNVQRKGNFLTIHVENYCTEFPVLKEGIPTTIKEDSTIHGFGVKSMQYIVNKYNGNMQIGKGKDLFIVNIILPIQKS